MSNSNTIAALKRSLIPTLPRLACLRGSGSMAHRRAPGPSLIERIYGVRSSAEFEELPTPTVVERFLRAKHGRSYTSGPTASYQILGEVIESSEIAHVVFRRPRWQAPQQQLESSVDVLTLRRLGEEWRCDLNGGLIYDSSGGFSIGFLDELPEGSDGTAA
jgi:hypothetical protein